MRRAVGVASLGTTLPVLSSVSCVALLLLAAVAHAHNAIVPLALWGGYFTPEATGCQRIITLAAQRCATTVWAARSACLSTQLAGGVCDNADTAAVIQQAHAVAFNLVERRCTSRELDPLGFSQPVYAEADVDIFCKQLEDAAASAVYGPALRNDAIVQVDGTAQRCIEATASVATPLLRVAFQARRHAVNTIAARPMSLAEKRARISQTTALIARASHALQHRLATRCSNGEFAAVYHRSPGALLQALITRGDCFAGATSVQDAMVCPPSECGNGMKEAGEECDDGNQDSGDGCHSDCVKESHG
jgi:cysteine-rich repeat protein